MCVCKCARDAVEFQCKYICKCDIRTTHDGKSASLRATDGTKQEQQKKLEVEGDEDGEGKKNCVFTSDSYYAITPFRHHKNVIDVPMDAYVLCACAVYGPTVFTASYAYCLKIL